MNKRVTLKEHLENIRYEQQYRLKSMKEEIIKASESLVKSGINDELEIKFKAVSIIDNAEYEFIEDKISIDYPTHIHEQCKTKEEVCSEVKRIIKDWLEYEELEVVKEGDNYLVVKLY
jgi:hypothetical protein